MINWFSFPLRRLQCLVICFANLLPGFAGSLALLNRLEADDKILVTCLIEWLFPCIISSLNTSLTTEAGIYILVSLTCFLAIKELVLKQIRSVSSSVCKL